MSSFTMKNLFQGPLRSKQTRVGIISLILFVSIITFVLYQGTKSPVIINVNGEEEKVYTHAKTVSDLFEEKGIAVSEYDKVTPSMKAEIKSGMLIEWEQAKEYKILVDGEESTIWTTDIQVKDILAKGSIEVSEHDKVSPALDANVKADEKIEIKKAFLMTLVDGTTEKQVWSTSTTVANFLKEQGIQLNEFDRVENDLSNVIKPQDKVIITRVEKVTDVVEEPVRFAIETKSDSSLLKGQEKVISKGEDGKVARTYEIVKENGQVVEKTLKSEEVVKEAKKQVVAVGTKVVTASVSRSKSSSAAPAGGKEFYVTATAYTPYCNGCSGTSAAGINLRANPNLKVIAVDPNVIPLGTKVWVEGYGYAVAGDTGGAIKGNKIDVLVQTKQQAYSWGRKKVKIKVLN